MAGTSEMTPDQLLALQKAEENQRQDWAANVKPTDYGDPTMPLADSQADYSPAAPGTAGGEKLVRALTSFLPHKDEVSGPAPAKQTGADITRLNDEAPAASPGAPNPQKTALVQAVLKSSPTARKALAGRNSAPPTDRDDEGNRIEPAQEAAAAPAAAPAPSSPSPYDLVRSKLIAQQASDADELKKAQALGLDQARINAGMDAWSKRHGVGGGSGGVDPESFVKNVLARRLQRTENAKELKETDANDPGSEKSLRSVRAAEAQFGLKPGTWSGKVAASELPDLLSGQKTVTDLQKERENRESAERVAAAGQKGENYRAQLREKGEMDRALLAQKGAELKRDQEQVPPAEEQKFLNTINAIPAGEALRKAHHEGGVTDPLTYGRTQEALGPAFVAGSIPGAREQPGLIKQEIHGMPNTLTPNGGADVYFDHRIKEIRGRARAQLESFGNGPRAQRLRQQFNQKEVEAATTRYGSNGTISVRSPSGAVKAIPVGQLGAALDAGGQVED